MNESDILIVGGAFLILILAIGPVSTLIRARTTCYDFATDTCTPKGRSSIPQGNIVPTSSSTQYHDRPRSSGFPDR